MKAHIANLVNSLALILLGAAGYFLSASPSPTALIPVVGGIILLVLTPALKAEKKHQAHAQASAHHKRTKGSGYCTFQRAIYHFHGSILVHFPMANYPLKD